MYCNSIFIDGKDLFFSFFLILQFRGCERFGRSRLFGLLYTVVDFFLGNCFFSWTVFISWERFSRMENERGSGQTKDPIYVVESYN